VVNSNAFPSDAMSPAEAAERLGISLNTVYRHIRNGRLPARRLGRRLLIGRRELRRWLAGSETPPRQVGQYE